MKALSIVSISFTALKSSSFWCMIIWMILEIFCPSISSLRIIILARPSNKKIRSWRYLLCTRSLIRRLFSPKTLPIWIALSRSISVWTSQISRYSLVEKMLTKYTNQMKPISRTEMLTISPSKCITRPLYNLTSWQHFSRRLQCIVWTIWPRTKYTTMTLSQ